MYKFEIGDYVASTTGLFTGTVVDRAITEYGDANYLIKQALAGTDIVIAGWYYDDELRSI